MFGDSCLSNIARHHNARLMEVIPKKVVSHYILLAVGLDALAKAPAKLAGSGARDLQPKQPRGINPSGRDIGANQPAQGDSSHAVISSKGCRRDKGGSGILPPRSSLPRPAHVPKIGKLWVLNSSGKRFTVCTNGGEVIQRDTLEEALGVLVESVLEEGGTGTVMDEKIKPYSPDFNEGGNLRWRCRQHCEFLEHVDNSIERKIKFESGMAGKKFQRNDYFICHRPIQNCPKLQSNTKKNCPKRKRGLKHFRVDWECAECNLKNFCRCWKVHCEDMEKEERREKAKEKAAGGRGG